VKLNKISKSFFINLDRRKDRLDHIYKNTPFFTERFPAVDSKSLELTDEIKKLFPDGLHLKKKKSEIACALSHYRLWKQLIEDEDADNYLILEDDVVFEKGFTKFWNSVWSHHIPPGYHLLYLGGCQPYNKPLYHKVLQPYNNYFNNVKKQDFFTKDDHYWHMNASSYVISKQCASLMCQWVEQKGFDNKYSIEISNLDIFMINFVNKNKLFSAPNKLFHLNPLMARQLHEENDNIKLDKNSDIRFDEDKFTEESNSTYDVCFCCDSNLIEYAINPINALCQKNKNNNINIHFIYSGEESDLKYIEEFILKKPNISLNKYIVNELNIPTNETWRSIGHLSNATNLKLQIPEILKDVSRVIYFDIDTIPYVDLSCFDKISTQSYGIAMRQEIKNGWRTFNGSKGTATENKNPIPFGDRVIGNSGVMVLDLVRLRKNNFTKFCLQEKSENNYQIPTTGGDQDVINLFCKCNFDVLPDELNILAMDQLKEISGNRFKMQNCITFQKDGVHCLKRDNITEHSQGVLHFIGKEKPWNSDRLGSEFWNKFSLKPTQPDTDLITLHSSPGNKNVIYVVNGYDNYQMPDIWRYTKPTVISYAKKYNIDVIELRPKNLNKYVLRVFFKVDFLDTFINSHYEKAMLLDNDIAITNFTPDIFQQCNDNVLALDLSYSHPHIFEYCNTTFHNRFYPDKQKPQFSINSGLIILNKQSAIKMEQANQNLKSPEELSGIKTFKRDSSFMWEQCYFNYLINESKVTFTPLSDYQHWLAPYFSSIPISNWKFELSERPLNFIHMLESVGKTVGYRLMYECPEFFDDIPQSPFIELTKTQWCNFDDVSSKQNEFIKLKNEWIKLKDYDFLDFVAKNLPKRDIPKEKYTCYNPGKKIGIVSLYTPEISEYAIESEISIRDYAFKQGYTFHVYRDKLDQDSHPNWSKPQALLNHFDDHDVIIWMDSDTIIFDTNQKFENILSECVPIKKVIATEDIGSSLLNTGVLIFRNHKYTKNLIKKWLNFKGDKSGLYSSGGDQEVFCDILKSSDNFGNNRKIFLMSKFNTDPRFVVSDTFIMHFMAYGNALKSVFMRYWGSK